jgi:hypothetical protein
MRITEEPLLPTGDPGLSPPGSPLSPPAAPSADSGGGLPTGVEAGLAMCARLVIRARRLLLTGLTAVPLDDANAQWLVEQLSVGLPPAEDADLRGWLAVLRQVHLDQPPAHHAGELLPAPTGAELAELGQRLAELERRWAAPMAG